MTTNNEMLSQLKIKYRVSLRDIARVCNYSDASICDWVNNKRELSDEKLKTISRGIKQAYSIN